MIGLRVEALAGHEQRLQRGHVVVLDKVTLGVRLTNGAQGGGRGEQRLHTVIVDPLPKGTGIRGAHGFTFVENRGGTHQQGRIHDVGVAHHPADVRGGPHDLAFAHVVNVLHGPRQRHGVTAVVAHHTLGLTRGPGGVEDVERIGGRHGHGGRGFGLFQGLGPGQPCGGVRHAVSALARVGHGVLETLSFVDQDRRRRVVTDRQGLLDGRDVLDPAFGFNATRGRHDHGRLGIVDAAGELPRSEPTEHHRVNRAQTSTREHPDHGLRNHGHVQQNTVPLLHALVRERTGKQRHALQELAVGDLFLDVQHGRVVNEGGAVSVTGCHVAVQCVGTRVQLRVGEPAVNGRLRVIEGLTGRRDPLDRLSSIEPELLRVADTVLVYGCVRSLGHDHSDIIVGLAGRLCVQASVISHMFQQLCIHRFASWEYSRKFSPRSAIYVYTRADWCD